MSRKRIKGYWEKCTEKFQEGNVAKSRAGTLRLNEHISHVIVDRTDEGYTVAYSVAKWYLAEAKKVGVKI